MLPPQLLKILLTTNAIQFVAGQFLVDKKKIPRKYWEFITPLLLELENHAENIDSFQEQGWKEKLQIVIGYLHEFVEEPENLKKATVEDFLFSKKDQIGYATSMEDYNMYTPLIEMLEDEFPSKSCFREEMTLYGLSEDTIEKEGVYKYELPSGLCVYNHDKKEHFYLGVGTKNNRKILSELCDLFWILDGNDNKNILKIDDHISNGAFTYLWHKKKDIKKFRGPFLPFMKKKLQPYCDKGVQRRILFHGKPGGGKSLFCYNLAQHFGERIMIVSYEYFLRSSSTGLRMACRVYEPDVLIIDDIDRVGDLGKRLPVIELLADLPIKFVLLTCNSVSTMDDAFKRPGRIDLIIDFDLATAPFREELLKSLAKQRKLKIPKDLEPLLIEFYEATTTAYLDEFLKRVVVEGWNIKIDEYDITFQKLRDVGLIQKWNEQVERRQNDHSK